jgi:hypothetical protein
MVPATSAAEQEDVENTVGLYPPGQVSTSLAQTCGVCKSPGHVIELKP